MTIENTRTLLEEQLVDLRKQAIERSVELFEQKVAVLMEEVRKHDDKPRKAFPSFRPYENSPNAKFIECVCVKRFPDQSISVGQVNEVQFDLDETKYKAAVVLVIEQTNSLFDAYVTKLTEKIGTKVDSIYLFPPHSSNIWDASILKVVRSCGLVEHWKTQIVHKVNKYGTHYVQFPTRKLAR